MCKSLSLKLVQIPALAMAGLTFLAYEATGQGIAPDGIRRRVRVAHRWAVEMDSPAAC